MMGIPTIPPGAEQGVLQLIALINNPELYKAECEKRLADGQAAKDRLETAIAKEVANIAEDQRLATINADIERRLRDVKAGEQDLEARRASQTLENESKRAEIAAELSTLNQEKAAFEEQKQADLGAVAAREAAVQAREDAATTREAAIDEMKDAAETALRNATDLEAKWKAKMAAIEAAART